MFEKSSQFYDAIYSYKDYEAEARRLEAFIHVHKQSPGMTMLDVACGTGKHVTHLKTSFSIEGLDLDAQMLALARERHPDITFHHADMTIFDLPHKFDVVVCLFSAIGYVRTVENLYKALTRMAEHVLAGGVVIVEPWFTPEAFVPGTVHATYVDEPDLKIARINLSAMQAGLSILKFEYLVGTPERIDHFTERHELGLFTHEDYLGAFRAAGLQTHHHPEGLIGRGLYIGVQAAP